MPEPFGFGGLFETNLFFEAMKSNWEEITIEILSEHVGALAGFIVDDARAKCRCSPTTEAQSFLTEFVVFVSQELPESIDRASVVAQLRNALK